MNPLKPESIAERKIRERMELLALRPDEAQARVSYVASGPLILKKGPEVDFSYGLAGEGEDDDGDSD